MYLLNNWFFFLTKEKLDCSFKLRLTEESIALIHIFQNKCHALEKRLKLFLLLWLFFWLTHYLCTHSEWSYNPLLGRNPWVENNWSRSLCGWKHVRLYVKCTKLFIWALLIKTVICTSLLDPDSWDWTYIRDGALPMAKLCHAGLQSLTGVWPSDTCPLPHLFA